MGCAPDGRASRARAGQAEDDARAIGEHEAAALAFGHAAIHRVGVAEVVRGGQLVRAKLGAGCAAGNEAAQVLNQPLRRLRVHALIVVPAA